MKKIFSLIVLSLILMSCQNEKTAYVDNNKIMESFDLLKSKEEAFKLEEDSLKAKIQSMVAESGYQDLVTEYQSKAGKISKTEEENMYNKIMEIQQTISMQQQTLTQSLQQRKGTELDSMVNMVKTYIKDYGKSNGYSYIFGSNDSGNIIYGDDQKDITELIIKSLNDKYAVKDDSDDKEESEEKNEEVESDVEE